MPVRRRSNPLEMSDQIEITLPDGSTRKYPEGVTGLEIAKSISKGLLKAAVAMDVDGDTTSLREPLTTNSAVSIITRDSKEGLEVLRHSAAHVLADAISRLRPDVKLWKGPPVDDPRYGYYYDIDLGDDPITMADLPEIEKQMRKIVKANVPFEKEVLGREDARQLMVDNGEDYKVATISKIPGDEKITFYRSGEFVDLCRGPHVPSTGVIGKGVAVLSIAGAYFEDQAGNKMLTRIYGHAFADAKAMTQQSEVLTQLASRSANASDPLDLLAGGGTFGNPGDYPMTDDDGDDIWTITVTLPENSATDRSLRGGR